MRKAQARLPASAMETAERGLMSGGSKKKSAPKRGLPLPETRLSSAQDPHEPASTRQWHQTVSCEARNALQVIVSAGEILLDDPSRSLRFEQKALVEKILENAQHLNYLISSYFRPADANRARRAG